MKKKLVFLGFDQWLEQDFNVLVAYTLTPLTHIS